MEQVTEPQRAFLEALSLAGSQAALAVIAGKKQPAISKRLRGSGIAEPEEVLPIEQATGVSRHRLRPDIYPVDPPSPLSRTDGSVAGGAPVVLSDRRAVSDKVTDA